MRVLFLLICLHVCMLPAFAQNSFGVQAGPLLADMEFHDTEGAVQSFLQATRKRVGFSAGVMAELQLGQKLWLQPELAFRQKGYIEAPGLYTGRTSDLRHRWVMDYLDLALLVRVHPVRNSGFHLFAGPSLSRLTGIRIRDTGAPEFLPQYPLAYQTPPVGAIDPAWLGFSLLDLGLNAGIGHQFRTGGSKLAIDIRYQHGFANIHNGFVLRDLNGAPIGRMNSSNRVFMFTLGWFIPLPKAARQETNG
jgi:hypothetical protein